MFAFMREILSFIAEVVHKCVLTVKEFGVQFYANSKRSSSPSQIAVLSFPLLEYPWFSICIQFYRQRYFMYSRFLFVHER
jgi:hypothetical protein